MQDISHLLLAKGILCGWHSVLLQKWFLPFAWSRGKCQRTLFQMLHAFIGADNENKFSSCTNVWFPLCWFVPSSLIVFHSLNRCVLPLCLGGLGLLTSALILIYQSFNQTSLSVLIQGLFFLGGRVCRPQFDIPQDLM